MSRAFALRDDGCGFVFGSLMWRLSVLLITPTPVIATKEKKNWGEICCVAVDAALLDLDTG